MKTFRIRAPKTREINLLALFDELNAAYFDGKLCAGVQWKCIRIGAETVTYALCCPDERVIEMNTLLRDARIPLWYVRFVLFHEMIHLVTGHEHDDKFSAVERMHPDYRRALRFEGRKLDTIVDDWRRYRESRRRA